MSRRAKLFTDGLCATYQVQIAAPAGVNSVEVRSGATAVLASAGGTGSSEAPLDEIKLLAGGSGTILTKNVAARSIVIGSEGCGTASCWRRVAAAPEELFHRRQPARVCTLVINTLLSASCCDIDRHWLHEQRAYRAVFDISDNCRAGVIFAKGAFQNVSVAASGASQIYLLGVSKGVDVDLKGAAELAVQPADASVPIIGHARGLSKVHTAGSLDACKVEGGASYEGFFLQIRSKESSCMALDAADIPPLDADAAWACGLRVSGVESCKGEPTGKSDCRCCCSLRNVAAVRLCIMCQSVAGHWHSPTPVITVKETLTRLLKLL